MSGTVVEIGIPTYRRPELLARLLESIACLDKVPGCRVRILVVDNDPDGTAFDAATEARTKLGIDLLYFIEPARGISQARNRIIDNISGDYLAFLDDDEVVCSGWLKAMLDAMSRFDADVVFGPVRGALPENAPRWASIHPSFNRPHRSTGTKLALGGSGNVLIKTQLIADGRFQFDLRFSLTGGEDIDFFHRLDRAGAQMIWCEEAVAIEYVPPERLTLQWVMKRSFRGGQCYARIIGRERTGIFQLPRIIRKLIQLVIAIPLCAAVAPIAPARTVLVLSKIAGAFGEITVMLSLGSLYEEYATSKYRTSGAKRS